MKYKPRGDKRSSTEGVTVNEKEQASHHTVVMWKGRPMNELSRDELLVVIDRCHAEIKRLRADRDAWMHGGDVLDYMTYSRRV